MDTDEQAPGASSAAAASAEQRLLTLASHLCEGAPAATAVHFGLSGVLPLEPLQLFLPGEVESSLGCGSSMDKCDLTPLRKSAEYVGGASEQAPVVQWLWEVLEEGGVEDRLAFLKFVSERTRLPPGGTPQPLQVTFQGVQGPGGLPTAQTCFQILKLPQYASKAVLREKLLLAIHLCNTMDDMN